MRSILLIAIVVGVTANAYTAQAADSCRALLPNSLIAAIPAKFPSFRAPRDTDNLPEDIAYEKSHRGTGCLAVAVGDFDGSKTKQYLIGLSAISGPAGLAVIARPQEHGWTFQRIENWTEGRDRLYVETVKPGRYKRDLALDTAATGDERQSMICHFDGALIGQTESGGIVHCLVGGQWRYVQVED